MVEITLPRPLAEDDDRSAFDCGRESMNQWFRRHGWINHAASISRINVVHDPVKDRIVGYVTLSAAQIERASLAKAHQRNKPDPLPAALLGQLAVDKDYQGKGYAGLLLLFALRTALKASHNVGIWGVITHPLDEAVRGFYARYGFEDIPFDPRRAMVVRLVDVKRSGIGAG